MENGIKRRAFSGKGLVGYKYSGARTAVWPLQTMGERGGVVQ